MVWRHEFRENETEYGDFLEAVCTRSPSPEGDPDAPLQALIFDSIYDSYKPVVLFCRVMEGTGKEGNPV